MTLQLRADDFMDLTRTTAEKGYCIDTNNTHAKQVSQFAEDMGFGKGKQQGHIQGDTSH